MKFPRSLSFALIALILYQCMGYIGLHEIQLQAWKLTQLERMKLPVENGVNPEDIVTISVADPKILEWENAHEFVYQGEMYDVFDANMDLHGNWIYKCVADRHETALKDAFAQIIREQGNGDTSFPNSLNTRLFTLVYLYQSKSLTIVYQQFVSEFLFTNWPMSDLFVSPPIPRPPIFG